MSKHKLLLADDSITIQKVVNLTFADEGIEVISVGDGDAALLKINEFAPDLIMADVNMPGLNGYQICEKIKQNENLRRIPVILLVGSFEPFDEAEAKRVGADDFMTKPFQSIRQLVNKVSDLLDRGVPQNGEYRQAAAQNQDFVQTLPDLDEHLAAAPDYAVDSDDEMIESNQFNSTTAETAKLDYDFQRRYEDSSADGEKSFDTYRTVSDFDAESDAEFSGGQTKFADDDEPLETVNYSSETISETPANQNSAVYDFAENETDEATNQPAIVQNQELNDISPETEKPENAEDYANSQTLAAPSAEINEVEKSEEIPAPSAHALRFDDLDLLELPPWEKASPAPERIEIPAPPVEMPAVIHQEIAANLENTESPAQNSQLSPEMIEAIAQRVVEKLSEKFFDK